MVPAARQGGRFCRGKTECRTGDTIARNGHAQEVTEMAFKLTGMSEVTRNLEQLKKALDGAVAKVSFDPLNSQDVERAIREVEQKVDLKMAPYVSTPGVPEIAAGLKKEYRKALLQKAEEARRKSPA
jgi:hypothetical protein